ncbi:MAG: hypothetical protein IT314_10710 [Anaerolineales bacterium]|nr:hypothetical protein [Anaerolineales bacterium]
MTFSQLLTEIDRLSVDERIRLMEALTRSLQVELRPTRRKKRGSSLQRVMGVLRVKGGKVPSDNELREQYVNHLIQKHQ